MNLRDLFKKEAPHASLFGQRSQVSVRRTRTSGQYVVPVIIPGALGVRGVRLAVRNAARAYLTIKIIGAGPGVPVFISETEFVTTTDYFIDANDPLDVGTNWQTQSEVYAATNVVGVSVMVLETVIDEGGT